MSDLAAFAELVPLDHGLCVVTTLRADGSVHATVVNAGVLAHRQVDADARRSTATSAEGSPGTRWSGHSLVSCHAGTHFRDASAAVV